MFRPDNPLLPNYRWVPIGYHGRASSLVVSGTPIRRPRGQVKAPDAAMPEFVPTRSLDYELELGIFLGGNSVLGESLSMRAAAERIFAGHVAPADVKERALAWVPDAMRFAAAPEAAANVTDESLPWEDPSEDASDTAEVGSGAEEHSGGEIAPPASIAPEGEACVGRGSSHRRKGSGMEADGDVPPVMLEEAA